MHTVTIDGSKETRSARIFESMLAAKAKMEEQNAKAQTLEIKTRYKLTGCTEDWLQHNEKLVKA